MNNRSLNGLYAITDPKLMGKDLKVKAQQAIAAGIRILQYRNKTASLETQEQEALALAQLCKKNNVIFIINDNVELALKVNADGVHLGQGDTHIIQARTLLGENKIIGVTCNNNIELALNAQKNGADYIAFGRFFPSKTKPSAPHAELSLLREARKLITLPIVAIGGINHDSAPSLLKEGADMLAVIHAIFGQQDISNATQEFIKIIDSPDVVK